MCSFAQINLHYATEHIRAHYYPSCPHAEAMLANISGMFINHDGAWDYPRNAWIICWPLMAGLYIYTFRAKPETFIYVGGLSRQTKGLPAIPQVSDPTHSFLNTYT